MDIQLPASYERTLRRSKAIADGLRESPFMKAANLSATELGHFINNMGGREEKFGRSKWGVANAYEIISYVEKCVELISTGITSLPYVIKRFRRLEEESEGDAWEGIVVAKGDDVTPRHPLFQLLHNYQIRHHMSLVQRVAISFTMYDETYLELVREHDEHPVGKNNPLIALDWINPLGMSFQDNLGRITRYYYSPYSSAPATDYEPYEIAYKHGFNPRDDLRGYPDVLAVLDSLNIDDQIQRAVVSHFKNGIQAQAIVSPKEGFGSLHATRDAMGEVTKRSRGVEQVGGYTYWPKNIDVTPLDYPRYEQLTAYSQATIDRILDQFGVPRAIIGNSDIAGYKQGDEVTYRFYVGNIIPRAQDIVGYFNRQIMPLLPDEYKLDRLMVDSSEFDRVSENDMKEAELATQNLQASIITINEARKRQGLSEWEKDQGDLLILPVGTILTSPEDLHSGFIVGLSSEEAATTLASGREGPASALIGEMHQMLQNGQPGEGAEETFVGDVPIPAVGNPDQIKADFDSGFISLGQAMRARGQTPPPEQSALLDRLYKIDGKTIPIEQIENLGNPSPVNGNGNGATPDTKGKAPPVKLFPSEPDDWDWWVGKAQKELDNWYKLILQRGKKGRNGLDSITEFTPKHTRGTIADWILDSLKGYNKSTAKHSVKWYFEEVKRQLAIKAIQATRIDFEDDFDDALQVYIDGNSTRRQWSIRVRAMIRKADNKAFRDGLGDGGVEEEPDDEERVEINLFIAEQTKYVTRLGADVKSGKLASASGKGKNWFNKSVMPMYQAGLNSAAGNRMAEWALGKTKVHCRSCKGYNGQRHRYKHWVRIGAMPQSDELACHGDNCDCTLPFVKARARGKLMLIKSVAKQAKAFDESAVSRDEGGQFASQPGAGGASAPEPPEGVPGEDEPQSLAPENDPSDDRYQQSFEEQLNDLPPFEDVDFEEPGGFSSDWEDNMDDLPSEQRESVIEYTDGDFVEINNLLRHGEAKEIKDGATSEEIGQAKKQSSRIDAVLDRRLLSENIKSFRGDTGWGLPNRGVLTDDQFLGLTGSMFTDKGYSSTSVDPGEAFERKYRYEYLIPAGSRGAYINSISESPDEREFLIGRGTTSRIMETRIDDNGQRVLVMAVQGD